MCFLAACVVALELACLVMDRAACDYGLSNLTARRWITALFAPLEGLVQWLGQDRGDEKAARSAYFLVFAGLAYPAYFAGVWLVGRRVPAGHKGALALILVSAALFRATLVPFPPLLESSFNRYVWDGILTSHGINPYKYSPEDIEKAKSPAWRNLHPEPERSELQVLNLESRNDLATAHYFRNVTYRQLRSIYPPLSQLVWGLCAAISPGSGVLVKAANAAIDMGVVLLVLLLLIRIGANPCMVVAYAWNPLVIKEFSNSGHGDVHAIFFTTLALIYLVGERPLFAAVALACGSLAKVYPLALGLVFARKLGRQGLVVMGGLLILAVIPMIDVSGMMTDGLAAYARRWENNGSLYPVIRHTLMALGIEKDVQLKRLPTPSEDKELPSRGRVSRAVAGAIGFVFLCTLALRPQDTPRRMLAAGLAGIAAVQLLSPVMLPWYFTWGLPLLAVFPLRSFMFLSCTVACGWYGFHVFDGHPSYDQLKVASQVAEYVPFYLLLAWELRRLRTTSPGGC